MDNKTGVQQGRRFSQLCNFSITVTSQYDEILYVTTFGNDTSLIVVGKILN